MLALPGVVFLYNGQELGLPDVDLPDEVLQDRRGNAQGRTERPVAMAAGCRFPGQDNIPRSGSRRPGAVADAAGMGALTLEKQRVMPKPTLSFFDLHQDYVGNAK